MEKIWDKKFTALLHVLFFIWMSACSEDAAVSPALAFKEDPTAGYLTENVVVVVIDGPRYSDTWGKQNQPHIPYMAKSLSEQGVRFTNFLNRGSTYTLAGHTAITTGHYQTIANDGSEIPLYPSFLQSYLQQTGKSPSKACLVSSKAKLAALADSREMEWRGRFNPYTDCGLKGTNRSDAETLNASLQLFKKSQPNLMLVQFLGPDAAGHANNWPGYLEALQETDSLVHVLWTYLQTNEHYRNKTTLLITNDHGRHADGQKDGFRSHGDGCSSCRHISLLALGPDFAKGSTINAPYDQADLAPTIASLMGFEVAAPDGERISPLLIR